MTGIMAALKSDNDIGAAGKPVHDFAFAFVAPLRADNGYIGHLSSLR